MCICIVFMHVLILQFCRKPRFGTISTLGLSTATGSGTDSHSSGSGVSGTMGGHGAVD